MEINSKYWTVLLALSLDLLIEVSLDVGVWVFETLLEQSEVIVVDGFVRLRKLGMLRVVVFQEMDAVPGNSQLMHDRFSDRINFFAKLKLLLPGWKGAEIFVWSQELFFEEIELSKNYLRIRIVLRLHLGDYPPVELDLFLGIGDIWETAVEDENHGVGTVLEVVVLDDIRREQLGVSFPELPEQQRVPEISLLDDASVLDFSLDHQLKLLYFVLV